MPDIRVLLLLAAWAPGAVWAQTAAPEPLLAPPLVTAPKEPAFTPEPPQEAEVSRREVKPYTLSPARVSVEVLGGAAGGFLATMGTLIVANSSDVGRLNCRNGDVCDNRLLGLLAFAGCGLGSTAAVYASGELMGGQGRFLPTMITGLAMGGVGATLYYVGRENGAEVVIPLLTLPLVTSIVAYELSGALSDSPSRSLEVSPSAGVTWAPTLSVTPKGGTLGLAGRF